MGRCSSHDSASRSPVASSVDNGLGLADGDADVEAGQEGDAGEGGEPTVRSSREFLSAICRWRQRQTGEVIDPVNNELR